MVHVFSDYWGTVHTAYPGVILGSALPTLHRGGLVQEVKRCNFRLRESCRTRPHRPLTMLLLEMSPAVLFITTLGEFVLFCAGMSKLYMRRCDGSNT